MDNVLWYNNDITLLYLWFMYHTSIFIIIPETHLGDYWISTIRVLLPAVRQRRQTLTEKLSRRCLNLTGALISWAHRSAT